MSIQVSLNGLSFCALDSDEKRIIFFKELSFTRKLTPPEVLQKVQKEYNQEEFLKRHFNEVQLLFSNELYSIVPDSFFKQENASDFLKFNTKILETDFVSQDYLNFGKLVNVYIPFSNIINYFFDKYGEFEYRHSVSVLVEEFLALNKDQKERTNVYLNNHPWGYDLIIIQEQKLIFSNSFLCESKEDFIYYLLFTAEQLELDPEEFHLILLGHIAKDSDYYKIAYTYIKNIDFFEVSFGYSFSASETIPKGYKHFTLLSSLK